MEIEEEYLTTAYMLGVHDGKKKSESDRLSCSNWKSVDDELPPIDVPVWVYIKDRDVILIGGRAEISFEDWAWANTYGNMWHNGEKWDAELEHDDDYEVTHWMPLPTPPEHNFSRRLINDINCYVTRNKIR